MFRKILEKAISISSSEEDYEDSKEDPLETEETKPEVMANDNPPETLQDTDPPATESESLGAISIKLPDFWPATPKLWFQKVESQFALRGVTTEQTKYNHIMATISQEVALKIYDTINEPGETPYTTLKDSILKAFTPSASSLIKELLNDVEIGDRTPSQFFRHLATLAEGSGMFNNELLQSLWLERLPPQVKAILKIRNFKDSKEIIASADQVFEALRQSGTIQAISNPSSSNAPVVDLLQKLQLEVSELKVRFDKSQQPNRRSRQQSRSRGRNRSQSRSRNRNENSNFCYYHNRYGQDARNCKPPCTFKSNNGNGEDPKKSNLKN